MTTRDSHGRPIIVAAEWFGKLPAQPRKLKPGEEPITENSAAAVTEEARTTNSDGNWDRSVDPDVGGG